MFFVTTLFSFPCLSTSDQMKLLQVVLKPVRVNQNTMLKQQTYRLSYQIITLPLKI